MANHVESFGPITRIRTVCESGGFGWIHAYLDDEMGTLFIASDYGEWSYRWGVSGIGDRSFHDFILGRAGQKWGWHYVAEKLMYGHESTQMDERRTKREIRKGLADAWRNGVGDEHSPAYRAMLYRDAVRAVDEAEMFDDLYIDVRISAFYSVNGDDYRTEPSHEIVRLRELVLPAIGAAWLAHKAASVEAVTSC